MNGACMRIFPISVKWIPTSFMPQQDCRPIANFWSETKKILPATFDNPLEPGINPILA